MNPSNQGPPDAFSQTLEKTPRTQKNSQQRQQQKRLSTTSTDQPPIHRLSRLFEKDTTSTQSTKPKLPRKPPSLRSTQTNTHLTGYPPSPCHETTVENDDSNNVDQTSFAFQDIRARFQQSSLDDNKKVLLSKRNPSIRPISSITHESFQSVQKQDTQNKKPPKLLSHNSRKPPTVPRMTKRPDSMVAEISERLENGNLTPISPVQTHSSNSSRRSSTGIASYQSYAPGATTLPPPAPPPPPPLQRDMVADDFTDLPHPRLLIPKRLSSTTLKHPYPSSPKTTTTSTTGSSSIHMISRSGTGNSILSATSSSSSSSSSAPTTAPSPSKRTWNNYGNTITSWFGSSNTSEQQQQSLKDSITMVNSIPLSSSSSSAIDNKYNSSNTNHHATSTPPSLTPQSSGTKNMSQESKRVKIISEIVETEKNYQNDMLVLKEVYYDQALLPDSGFSPSDVKHVYSNLLAIVDFEVIFVDRLSSATSGDGGSCTLGSAFLDMMQQIDQVYCDYCKRHEDAVIRLQELETKPQAQQFLQRCAEQLQGRTQSWDLGSLLIKPVQRVLKYPLLLKELSSITPPDDLDHENLITATIEIQKVADHINEIKRRKDIVERIVGDKKKTEMNVVHGINKKITRKAHRIRQVTGLAAEATQDTIFDTLYQKFEDQQELARQLARDIQTWVRQVKDNFDNLLEFATSLEEVYSSFGGVRVRSMNQIKEFTKLASNFRMVISRELDTMIYAYTYAKIEGFLAVFENPTQVINKRGQKLLDYDRVRGIKARGDIPDKTLQESADMYVSINAQLVEELPLLFNLTRQYFDIIVGDLAMVQTRFYEMTCREWNKLMQHLRQDPNDNRDNSSFDAIIANYQREMNNHVQPLIDDIMPLNKEQWKMILGALPLTPLADDLTGGSNNRTKLPSDGYFDRNLSVQSFNDDDTRSSISSRKYGSSIWKANRGTMMDLGGTTDDDHSKVTTPSQNDDFSNSRSQGYSESSNNNNNNNNLAEPAFECVVIHDYLEPSMEALSVRKGDVIQVWVEDEDEQGLQGAWLYASISVGHSEHFGWVPSQFCRRL